MAQLDTILLLAGIATLLLYIWIVWTASSNGRSSLVWFILTFFISPWLVAILLAIAGESSTQKELRELKISVSPNEADLIQERREKDVLIRFILGMIVLVLYVICVFKIFDI